MFEKINATALEVSMTICSQDITKKQFQHWLTVSPQKKEKKTWQYVYTAHHVYILRSTYMEEKYFKFFEGETVDYR